MLVGIPATHVSTFVVELPPVEDSLHASMILAQVDKRGLAAKGSALVDYVRIPGDRQGAAFAVAVVPDLPGEWVVSTAAGYALSADLRASTETAATVWRELGRFVLAVRVGGVLSHVQMLSGKPEVGAPLAQEVNLVLLGLKGEAVYESSGPMELTLLAEREDLAGVDAFRSALSIPVCEVTGALPAKGEARPRLLPAEVTRRRRRRRAAVRNAALLVAGLIVYAVVGVWVWKSAQATKREIESLERRIAIVQPDVDRIKLAEERWRSLEPAFDKDLDPVLQLSRITAALPGSGVVIREYRTTGRIIRLKGQARDVQLANRLLEDLRGMEGFRRYEWSMPNPKVERNNTATFEIEGKPKNESVDG